MQHILQANEPTVLPEKASEKLTEIAGWNFEGPDAPGEALLSPEELRLLSIPKGSLDSDERLQIESHVIHSFRFLNQIPWTKELKNIPDIARGHHEKLDGSGYPYHMKDEEIPFQSKIMTIADIFDALTARDRPYKRAVPVERALDIIGHEVEIAVDRSGTLPPLRRCQGFRTHFRRLTGGACGIRCRTSIRPSGMRGTCISSSMNSDKEFPTLTRGHRILAISG